MGAIILILRPQPGADETARRARNMGLEARIAPLFTVRPLDWEPPDPVGIDAVLLTSANGARHAGPAAGGFVDRPCYAVGEATALAAREAGFADVRTGASDGAALLEKAAAEGVMRALHLCGRDHLPLEHSPVIVIRRIVYAAELADGLPPAAAAAMASGVVALLHSPRAARTFAKLADEAGIDRGSVTIAAISPAALESAGGGWAVAEAALQPRDEALLELAAKLCQHSR